MNKITKKLVLNKKTIADLNHRELESAHGGNPALIEMAFMIAEYGDAIIGGYGETWCPTCGASCPGTCACPPYSQSPTCTHNNLC